MFFSFCTNTRHGIEAAREHRDMDLPLQTVTELVGKVLGKVSEYGLLVVLAREFGAGVVGAFAVGFVLLHLGGTVGQFGTGRMVQRYVPVYRDDPERQVGTVVLAVGVTVLGGTTVYVSLLALSRVGWFPIRLDPVTGVLLSGVPVVAVVKVLQNTSRSFGHSDYAVGIEDVLNRSATLLVLLVLTGVLAAEIDPVDAAVVYLGTAALGAVVGLLLVVGLVCRRGVTSVTLPSPDVLRYSATMTVASVAAPALLWTDVLVLSALDTGTTVGQYQVAYQLSLLPTVGLVAVSGVFPSLVSRLNESGSHDRLGLLFLVTTKWLSVFGALVCGYVFVFSNALLSVFGEAFVGGATTLRVLLLAQTISVLTGPVHITLVMTGEQRSDTVDTVAAAAGNCLLNVVAVAQYGMVGAAVATGLSIVALDVRRVLRMRRLIDLSSSFPGVSRPLATVVATTAAYVTVRTATDTPQTALVGGTVVGVIAGLVAFAACHEEMDEVLFATIVDW